jgi:hypothetical protein
MPARCSRPRTDRSLRADVHLRLRACALLAASLVLTVGARGARGAAVGRLDVLVLGTHDPALASALSVAVSPRGLSVVELADPLTRTSDLEAAQRELAVQDAVAVVWLCDDAHALCFCGRDGRLITRPVSVASPLAPPDAAALALSVKVLLAQATPPAAAPPPPRPPEPAAGPAPSKEPQSQLQLPSVTVELAGGAHVQSRAPSAGARFGLTGVFAPDAFARALGFGLGLTAGPRQTVSDVALRALARGRLQARPLWLELDLGPSAHLLSGDVGPAVARRTVLSLDALAGVVLPLGAYFAGVRAGALFVPAPAFAAPALPRWTGEAMLIFGANVL